MALLAIACYLVSFLAAAFYLYRKFYRHRFFKRLGLPGPEPHWLYGNLLDLKDPSRRHLVIHEWSQRYGPFYGFYEGGTPVLVVSSIEGVEQICVKQFWNFQGHRICPVQPDPETDSSDTSIFTVDVLYAWREQWKRLRSHLNPGFTSAKMKATLPTLNNCLGELMAIFDKKAQRGEAFNILEDFHRLTVEVIGQVAFGVQFGSLNEESNGAVTVFQRTMKLLQERPAILNAVVLLPELAPLLKRFARHQAKHNCGAMSAWFEFNQLFRQVVEQRVKKNGFSKRNFNLLENLIENSDLSKNAQSKNSLTFHEVVAQCMTLFIAGAETSGTGLGFLCYLLATHEDVQEKLFQEISKNFPSGDIDDYEALINLPYLDWVCKESLRIFPLAVRAVARFVVDDTEVCGITIPARRRVFGGYYVLIDMFSIHFDPDIWGPVDPAKFYPERFSPTYASNRPDAAFLAFGYGPRICLGMRLGMLQMKLALANLVRRYRIVEPDEGYPDTGLPVTSELLLKPSSEYGVPVKLVIRE